MRTGLALLLHHKAQRHHGGHWLRTCLLPQPQHTQANPVLVWLRTCAWVRVMIEGKVPNYCLQTSASHATAQHRSASTHEAAPRTRSYSDPSDRVISYTEHSHTSYGDSSVWHALVAVERSSVFTLTAAWPLHARATIAVLELCFLEVAPTCQRFTLWRSQVDYSFGVQQAARSFVLCGWRFVGNLKSSSESEHVAGHTPSVKVVQRAVPTRR